MAKETTVWIKPLDLPWEQVGTGQFQGITPENINLEADTWGPSNATFDLRRDPDAPALDLSAGAEVEVHVAGVNVWDGFVSSTPKKRGDLVTSVVCRGWQDELDGRIFTAGYVHTTLSDFKDARSNVSTALGVAGGNFPAAPTVSSDNGLTLMWAKSVAVSTYSKVGVLLDLGPGLTGKRIVIDWTSSNNDSAFTAAVSGGDSAADLATGAGETPISFAMNSGASGTAAGTFTTARRYVWIFVQDSGAGHTPSDDVWLKITGCRVFTDTAYESGNASVLKASTVVKDALAKGTLALSSDLSGIDATSFSIPDLWPTGELTARELISKVNAYHNWTAKLAPGRRFIFAARSTVPRVKVGEWSAMPDDEDASSNDITDIYNHCRAKSTDAGGRLVVVDRYSTQQAAARPYTVSSPAADNPSLATNTTSWSTTAGTLTRDTTVFDTTPAALRLDATGAGDDLVAGGWFVTETMTGPFKAGIPYAVTVRIRSSVGTVVTGVENLGLRLVSGTDTASASFANTPGTTWTSYTINWTPSADRATASLKITSVQGNTVWWFDSVTVAVVQPTILDKRARVRSMVLDATAALPADGVALTQLADTWLAAHMSTPFKGKQSIQGAQSVRDYLTGDNVAPERLLAMTGDLLHFDDRIDPDTGDIGRDGRLVKVAYQPLTDTAQSDVDSTRSDFGALLVRIGVLTAS